jgi:hypothetical protein
MLRRNTVSVTEARSWPVGRCHLIQVEVQCLTSSAILRRVLHWFHLAQRPAPCHGANARAARDCHLRFQTTGRRDGTIQHHVVIYDMQQHPAIVLLATMWPQIEASSGVAGVFSSSRRTAAQVAPRVRDPQPINIHSDAWENLAAAASSVWLRRSSSRSAIQHCGWERISAGLCAPRESGRRLRLDKCDLDSRFPKCIQIRLRNRVVCDDAVHRRCRSNLGEASTAKLA